GPKRSCLWPSASKRGEGVGELARRGQRRKVRAMAAWCRWVSTRGNAESDVQGRGAEAVESSEQGQRDATDLRTMIDQRGHAQPRGPMALQAGYVKQVAIALSREDGELLEECLSISPAIAGEQRLLESRLSDDDVEAACSGGGRDSLPPVAVSLCREMLLYLQAVKNDDAREAFKHYRGAFRVFVEDNSLLGFRGGQSGWLLPTLATMSRGVRLLANEKTDLDDEDAQADVIGLLHTAFSACLRDRSTDPVESKKLMAMHMAVVLFKHCFKLNRLRMCQDLSKNVRGGTGDAESLAVRADVVAFLYYEGKTFMHNAANDKHERAKAETTLTRALKECHVAASGNRRRILVNLVPLRMRMGCLPERRLLEKYDLLIFDDFSTAIRQGNLKRFSLLMKQHERALILSDLLPHLEGCRLMMYRQVLKQIATATDANVLPFRVIVLGLVLRGHEFDIDNDSFDPQQSAEERELARWDEVTFILAGLIMDGLISGVVRSRDAQLLLSKKTGFPDLPEVTETGLRPRLRPRPPSRHLGPTSTFNTFPAKVKL
ncbi:unnamed protein product, partial [Ectocarpus sp. 6 AP-2014]